MIYLIGEEEEGANGQLMYSINFFSAAIISILTNVSFFANIFI